MSAVARDATTLTAIRSEGAKLKKKLNTELLDATKDLLRDIDDSLEGSRQVTMRARMDSLFVGEEDEATGDMYVETGWTPGPKSPHDGIYCSCVDAMHQLEPPLSSRLVCEGESGELCHRTHIPHPLFGLTYDNVDALAYQSAFLGEPATVRYFSFSGSPILGETVLKGRFRSYYKERLAYYEEQED